MVGDILDRVSPQCEADSGGVVYNNTAIKFRNCGATAYHNFLDVFCRQSEHTFHRHNLVLSKIENVL